MEYELVLTSPEGNNQRWVIKGLQDNTDEDDITPDTTLWLVGLRHSCDSVDSIVRSVYGAVYDWHQCNSGLKTGDIIRSKPTIARKYHTHDPKAEQIPIPEIVMEVNSYHIILRSPEINWKETSISDKASEY